MVLLYSQKGKLWIVSTGYLNLLSTTIELMD